MISSCRRSRARALDRNRDLKFNPQVRLSLCDVVYNKQYNYSGPRYEDSTSNLVCLVDYQLVEKIFIVEYCMTADSFTHKQNDDRQLKVCNTSLLPVGIDVWFPKISIHPPQKGVFLTPLHNEKTNN